MLPDALTKSLPAPRLQRRSLSLRPQALVRPHTLVASERPAECVCLCVCVFVYVCIIYIIYIFIDTYISRESERE